MATPAITFPADSATLSYVRGTGFVPPLFVTTDIETDALDLTGGTSGGVFYTPDVDPGTSFSIAVLGDEPAVGSGTVIIFAHNFDGGGDGITVTVNVTDPPSGIPAGVLASLAEDD